MSRSPIIQDVKLVGAVTHVLMKDPTNEQEEAQMDMIQCIEYMETLYDWALAEGIIPEALIQYYTGGQWLRDFEADQRGELPPDLKRGVLSEDGLWNLLTNVEDL